MEALILARISELLSYRAWHFRNRRLYDWPDLRHDDRVELRALLRLLRQYRRENPDPYPSTATYDSWTQGEMAEAFGR